MSQRNDKILYVFKATVRQEVVATSHEEAIEKLNLLTVTPDQFEMVDAFPYCIQDTTEER